MFNKITKIIRSKWKRSFDYGLDITEEELLKYQREGAIIVDVRSPQEFKEDHINGAICIPEYNIKREAQNIIKNKNSTIIVYCSTGHRSKKAQEKLKKLGYSNVYNVYGGIII